jgi:threonyl-tRNA synthetase
MKILQTHSDWIEYEPIKKEIPQAEDTERKIYKINDVLVVFTAVEEGDDEEVAKRAIDEIKEFMTNLKIDRILIYPFVHLSNKPAKPDEALKILKIMESYAKELNLETYRAPFGWNKRVTNAVKGHPLAEQSKVFVPGEKIKERKGLEITNVTVGHIIWDWVCSPEVNIRATTSLIAPCTVYFKELTKDWETK